MNKLASHQLTLSTQWILRDSEHTGRIYFPIKFNIQRHKSLAQTVTRLCTFIMIHNSHKNWLHRDKSALLLTLSTFLYLTHYFYSSAELQRFFKVNLTGGCSKNETIFQMKIDSHLHFNLLVSLSLPRMHYLSFAVKRGMKRKIKTGRQAGKWMTARETEWSRTQQNAPIKVHGNNCLRGRWYTDI